MVYVFTPSTSVAEAGTSLSFRPAKLYSETASKKKKKKKRNPKQKNKNSCLRNIVLVVKELSVGLEWGMMVHASNLSTR